MKYLIYTLLFSSLQAFAILPGGTTTSPYPSVPLYAKANMFIQYTCNGLTTAPPDAPAFTPVLTVFFPIKSTDPYPSVFELRNKYQSKFHFITKECNRRRYDATTFSSGRPAVWPDWGNDRKYQKVAISEVMIDSKVQHRAGGVACQVNQQCESLLCDQNTNACTGSPE